MKKLWERFKSYSFNKEYTIDELYKMKNVIDDTITSRVVNELFNDSFKSFINDDFKYNFGNMNVATFIKKYYNSQKYIGFYIDLASYIIDYKINGFTFNLFIRILTNIIYTPLMILCNKRKHKNSMFRYIIMSTLNEL